MKFYYLTAWAAALGFALAELDVNITEPFESTCKPNLEHLEAMKTIDLPEPCWQKPLTSFCYGLFESYAYDHKEGACVLFVYGGCMGCQPFANLEDCQSTCRTNKTIGVSSLTHIISEPHDPIAKQTRI